VGGFVPNVAFASRVAIPSLTAFIADRRVLTLLMDELTSASADSVLAPLLRARLCATLRAALRTPADKAGAGHEPWRPRAWSRAVPGRLRAAVRGWRVMRPALEPLVFAFRAFVATRMHALLRRDGATKSATPEAAITA
jgi:hypothetical protein